jgi:hypothetical protein
VGKNCNNPQCFKEQSEILNQLNIKKKKSIKTIIGKKIKKKTMWRNTIAIHSVLKKKNYKAKFSTSSILKK